MEFFFLSKKMEFFLSGLVFALCCAIGLCTSTGSSSSNYHGIGWKTNKAMIFPVFHRNHPFLDPSIQAANILPGATVIEDDSMRKNEYFMGIGLGTPAIFNLVTIDTGSALSWVQCQHCDIRCHAQAESAGKIFNPFNSSTYRGVGCSTDVCRDVHLSLGIFSGCVEEKDTCLYTVRYGSGEYSVGYLGEDKLTLENNYNIDSFLFGCGVDNKYNGFNAGMIGFGNESYSFFNQVSQQTNYSAFSYCFPGDHENEGYLSIGPYIQDNLMWTKLIGYDRIPVYAIQQLDMMVNGIRLDIDPVIYSSRLTVVDSGTADTFILSPVFHAFDKVVTAAMLAKGYTRGSEKKRICFTSNSGSVNWNDFPTVEMKFVRSTMKLPVKNMFYENSYDEICSTIRPDDSGVRGVQILGNRATRSFRLVFDIQGGNFGFQANAC